MIIKLQINKSSEESNAGVAQAWASLAFALGWEVEWDVMGGSSF